MTDDECRIAAMKTAPLSPAVFFDRDGTLMEETDYCNDPAKVALFPQVGDALLRLHAAGYKNILVTNQSGIARGLITPEQFELVQKALIEALAPARLDAVYFCPDLPGTASPRRKPSPAMVLEAAVEHHLDLSRSFFVGDRASDIACGKNAGVKTVLVETGYGKQAAGCTPDFHVKDVIEAADLILRNSSR